MVSEALGYASDASTIDTQSEVVPGMQEDAMALLDGVLPSGVAARINGKLTAGFLDLASKEESQR